MSSQSRISVSVRLYSILRERDGRIVDRLEIELDKGSHVADALRWLNVPDDLEVVLAVNDQVVSESTVLHDRDRLSVIPSIAGGAQVTLRHACPGCMTQA